MKELKDMTVSGPHEELSTSPDEPSVKLSRASAQERESVNCVCISERTRLFDIPSGTPSDRVRQFCIDRFDSLYPEEKPCQDELPLNASLRQSETKGNLLELCRIMKVDGEVSVRIAAMFSGDTDRRWYVFRLNYGRGQKEIQETRLPGCTFYLPVIEKKLKSKGGEPTIVRETYLDHLVFAYTTRSIAEIVHHSLLLPTVRFYYDHFGTDPRTGYNAPLTIPRGNMMDFMMVAEARSFDKKIIDPARTPIKPGARVEITDGPFKGVRGILTRVSGKQRVVVDAGLFKIATGYISGYGYKLVEGEEGCNTNELSSQISE